MNTIGAVICIRPSASDDMTYARTAAAKAAIAMTDTSHGDPTPDSGPHSGGMAFTASTAARSVLPHAEPIRSQPVRPWKRSRRPIGGIDRLDGIVLQAVGGTGRRTMGLAATGGGHAIQTRPR